MAPIDPAIGEFRVHYAGFFDPGFGQGADGRPSARAVLEVRSRDVPFLLEDGQPVGRLVYEALGDAPEPQELYGAGATSNYQGQGLKLAEAFSRVRGAVRAGAAASLEAATRRLGTRAEGRRIV